MQPRWGKIGEQRIVDEEPLPPHPMPNIKYESMETFDEVIRNSTINFIDRANRPTSHSSSGWSPTRMHVLTHLSPTYQALMTPENGWYTEEAGMAQMDDEIGAVLQHLKDIGVKTTRLWCSPTDNGAICWPDGGMTPFAGSKGMGLEAVSDRPR